MTSNELRQRFLDFFASRGHRIVPSYSLVPKADPTLLFTSAGMNQFKEEFMGRVKGFNRAATCQKCLRTDDIEKVGKTAGHHTFFEMLGNFSFGDYFKEEAILWAWEFLTEELRLKEEDLWVSVYRDDQVSYDIWRQKAGVSEGKIVRFGQKENFWPSNAPSEGPDGPCGPCSEIFFDQGGKAGCGRPTCGIGCDCNRFVEVWNLVFTQYNRIKGGVLVPLPSKNIDTGMGLERLARVMQKVLTNFETDLFRPILATICGIIQTEFPPRSRIPEIYAIADHIRAIAFAISDGVFPSNEERGYVVRKLIRKADLHGRSIGIELPFLYQIVPSVAPVMKQAYPELEDRKENISQIVLSEEQQFSSILESAQSLFSQKFEKFIYAHEGKEAPEKPGVGGLLPVPQSSGIAAFELYDTSGIPLEVSQALAKEHGFLIAVDEFNKAMEEQRQRSRQASLMKGGVFVQERLKIDAQRTDFLGYQNYKTPARVLKIFKENEEVPEAGEADRVQVILDRSPFYGEAGGQVGDTGTITIRGPKSEVLGLLEVSDTKKADDIIVHLGKVIKGKIKVDDQVEASVDRDRRLDIARNHTATHLLQAALRRLLGSGVEQSGSLVAGDRLRFDFTHFEAIPSSQLDRIEEMVNEAIRRDDHILIEEMSLEEAKRFGAIALFGEKYGSSVRVVTIGDYSKELCGGTHVNLTGQIGLFKITAEASIAAGIRRIEAITGQATYKRIKQEGDIIASLTEILKTSPDKVVGEIDRLTSRIKELEGELNALKLKISKLLVDEIVSKAILVHGVKLIAQKVEKADIQSLRSMVDLAKEKLSSVCIVLGSSLDDKVSFVAGLTDDLVEKGLHAGQIIKEVAKITNGGGGGRPDLAQAGGKDPSKLGLALDKVVEIVERQLKSYEVSK